VLFIIDGITEHIMSAKNLVNQLTIGIHFC